ncbi:glycosyltransferase [Leptolyngbya boryana CZ1]|uniref:Glycosyltransferase n=1 Tax=Leptolyngbya boryana CZ1 TaxID=3060204 RepID=A0AA97AL69_LEPBY|nr:glycosyltransferase [Leptolyngbya boryana]WNZ43793.1 glycosyltransferase [Leptolyngbya boryana CZ1]
MKVCITTLEFPPDVGGVGESVHRISKMLLTGGYEVHVAVFRASHRTTKDGSRRRASCTSTLQDGIHVHRIQNAVRGDVVEIQDFYSDVYFYLKQLHQKHHFDLFHTFFMTETGYVTTMLAREQNVPIINSVRGSDLHKHILSAKYHAPLSWVLENAAWNTFVSRDLKRRGEVIAPSIAHKSSAFWNSIVPVEFTHLPTPTLASELSGVVIGSVGRLRDKKGIEFLLDACEQISSEVNFTLLLIGDFIDKERAYWEQELQRSELGDRLKITGIISRQEALAYLPLLDIYAIPSLNDGCPNALLEAMCAGCPIIGSNVDAIGEILEHHVNGVVVNPGDTEALANAIRYLADKPDLRKTLGKAAQQTAIEKLAPEVEYHNWMQVYHNVLDQKNSTSSLKINVQDLALQL